MNFVPNLENVVSVYSGKAYSCACGCKGKHTYASAYVNMASAIRGYEVKPDEVNDRTVKMIFNKVFGGKYGPALNNDDTNQNHDIYYLIKGNREYIIYFKKD